MRRIDQATGRGAFVVILFAAAVVFSPTNGAGQTLEKKGRVPKPNLEFPKSLDGIGPGGLVLVSSATSSDELGERGFVLFPESGVYDASGQPVLCFGVSHKVPDVRPGRSYLAVLRLSFMDASTPSSDRPVSLFRNPKKDPQDPETWSRPGDLAFSNQNGRRKELGIGATQFSAIHAQGSTLEALDAALTHEWHGVYGESEGQSWEDRDRFRLSEVFATLPEDFKILVGQPRRIRLDADLLTFRTTTNNTTSSPLGFCADGREKDGLLIHYFSPGNPEIARTVLLDLR